MSSFNIPAYNNQYKKDKIIKNIMAYFMVRTGTDVVYEAKNGQWTVQLIAVLNKRYCLVYNVNSFAAPLKITPAHLMSI